ncbi:MAG TPA: hypothetical protein VIM12_11835 [Noviherbaspirillum sp.]|jgi:tetratricopeptide (TPR) repeat protein|uniref:tetratricopeptide repeat protein n=1 Tax=Noviherbaspirillum sp. TaxID=1926288 RepID=UPI002F927F53
MTSCIGRTLRAALCGVLALPLAAHADYAAEVARLKSAPANDVTLVSMQAGLAAFSEKRMQEAAGHLDAALAAIEGMFANTEAAAKARSLWYEEGAKDFKGEPYERAMAYYYRGLAYLVDADYENARASFRSALLQDAFAEEEQFRSDFALLMMLEGWSNQLAGDMAQANEAYAEVKRLLPDWEPPKPGANGLLVAELGGSPRKLGDGVGNHEIVYRPPRRTPERKVAIDIDGARIEPPLMEDLLFQASTRGGRPVDRIIAGKVSFKEATGDIGLALGRVASDGSVIASATGGGGQALGAVAAIGAIASIISANVRPRADVRYWANLPERVHASAFTHRGLPSEIAVQAADAAGNPVPLDRLAVNKWIDRNGKLLVWIKTRN